MEIPFKGQLSREKILEMFSGRIFYVVTRNHYKHPGYSFVPCILNKVIEWDVEKPYVNKFDENFAISKYPSLTDWKWLHNGWEEARKACNHYNKLYEKGFYQYPFVELETLEEHKGDMIFIERSINKALKDEYPNFLGIDFCDVCAHGGIQIRGHHKEIPTHTYGDQPTVKYDFSNKNEVITEFIEMWKESDTPENVRSFKDFIDFGNKYGWD